MLEEYFYPIIQQKRMTKKIIFQQDGAPAHFSKAVRSWLNNKFPDRWIGRGGPISWAPRSPYLTPLDFFLWGHVKTNVYKTKVQDIDDLKARITQEIKTIKTETLHNVFSEISKRMNSCISVEGDTFEQYLWSFFVWIKTWQWHTSYERKTSVKFNEIDEIFKNILHKRLLGHPV